MTIHSARIATETLSLLVESGTVMVQAGTILAVFLAIGGQLLLIFFCIVSTWTARGGACHD